MEYSKHHVHHREAAESYAVPLKADQSRHVFTSITDTALMRAVRHLSTLSFFNANDAQ